MPGETGLVTTVTLIYAGPDGILGTSDDVSTPTTTDANGDYTFPNLLPGQYQIVETNPANYVSLADADGGNPDNISLTLALGRTRWTRTSRTCGWTSATSATRSGGTSTATASRTRANLASRA